MLSPLSKPTLTLVILASLAAPLQATTTGESHASVVDAPFSDLSVQDAAVRAQKENRLLVLFFDNENSPDARRMLERTWVDEGVVAWLRDNALALQIPPTDSKTRNQYGVSSYPQTILIDPDGMQLLHKVEGHATATEMIIGLSAATLGGSQTARPDGQDAENPLAWMAWGNYLFSNDPGRSIECLDAYLWCLDKGDDHIEGFRAYYFEFLMQRIAYLRSYTIKAAEALLTRRDRWRAGIIAGIATETEIDEYMRFCFWLRDEPNILDAVVEMRDLSDEHQVTSRKLIRAELNRAVARQMYDDILRLDPAPLTIIDARLTALDKTPPKERTKSSGFFDERLAIIRDASCYFEALLASSRAGDAFELVDRVVKDAPTGVTFQAFMERTNRLRVFPLTERLAKQGLEMVGDRGRKHIEGQLGMIRALKAQDEREAKKEGGKDKHDGHDHDHEGGRPL